MRGKKPMNLARLRFGRLSVQRMGKPVGDGLNAKGRARWGIRWWCRCDCGRRVLVRTNCLRKRNGTQSCGCLMTETARIGHTIHGGCGTPEHRCWRQMQSRCLNQRNPGYCDYGGRGIKICTRWLGREGFARFLADVGRRPSSQHSLDRINVDGDYKPDNVRWATRTEQNQNRRSCVMLSLWGKTQNASAWAEETGLSPEIIRARIRRGWDAEQILTTPIRLLRRTRQVTRAVWRAIQYRCFSPKCAAYEYYGGRGIRMCCGWRESFQSFCADLSPRPSRAHSLERINNNAHYSCGHCIECRSRDWPANCRWATRREQSRNKKNNVMLTHDGKTRCLSDWAKEIGISTGTLSARRKAGWPAEKMLTTAVGHYYHLKGKPWAHLTKELLDGLREKFGDWAAVSRHLGMTQPAILFGVLRRLRRRC